jgi:hypothetical protein
VLAAASNNFILLWDMPRGFCGNGSKACVRGLQWARPVGNGRIEAQARDRKHELAQPYEPNDRLRKGLVYRAPAGPPGWLGILLDRGENEMKMCRGGARVIAMSLVAGLSNSMCFAVRAADLMPTACESGLGCMGRAASPQSPRAVMRRGYTTLLIVIGLWQLS